MTSYGFRLIPAQSGLYSWESATCASISQNPYFFLLASALLRSFASRIESETTRFNRNPYNVFLSNALVDDQGHEKAYNAAW
ncbi:hypothetical protein, partial [Deinococcus wulumuqiensis]|uniref:hypothetical protein n=1 Tax=Deinococcus wulumuqiensis TaxID=980427 RepID=UPI001CEF6ABA